MYSLNPQLCSFPPEESNNLAYGAVTHIRLRSIWVSSNDSCVWVSTDWHNIIIKIGLPTSFKLTSTDVHSCIGVLHFPDLEDTPGSGSHRATMSHFLAIVPPGNARTVKAPHWTLDFHLDSPEHCGSSSHLCSLKHDYYFIIPYTINWSWQRHKGWNITTVW